MDGQRQNCIPPDLFGDKKVGIVHAKRMDSRGLGIFHKTKLPNEILHKFNLTSLSQFEGLFVDIFFIFIQVSL